MNLPRVYVINLDRRPDRWAKAEMELKNAGFQNYERVSGVDGKLIDSQQLRQILHPESFNVLGSKSMFVNPRTITTLGAVGCTLSHYKIWDKIVQSGMPGFVAEDDLEFRSHTTASMPNNIAKYDFVVLGFSNLQNFEKKKDDENAVLQPLLNPAQFSGTHFYYITPEVAKVFMSFTFPLHYQTDVFLSNCLEELEKRHFKAAIAAPKSLVTQSNLETDIQSGHNVIQYILLGIAGFILLILLLLFLWRRFRRSAAKR